LPGRPHLCGFEEILVGRHRQERGREHSISIHIQWLLGEGNNESYVLKTDHFPFAIVEIECALERQLAFNTKEVFLECSERSDPERGTSTHGSEMGSI
jgi:hypothetical protein